MRAGGYETEVLAFHTMAKKGIGPQLLGVFPGGRVEQFIPDADILTPDDSGDKELMSVFARKIAKIHATQLPFSKKPKDLLLMLEELVDQGDWEMFVSLAKKRKMPETPEAVEAMGLVSDITGLKSTLNWYRETEEEVNGKVTLTHGDLNPANCLIVEQESVSEPDQRLVLLDYEFTGYGYRGMDIGTHFHYRGMDFKQVYTGRVIQHPHPNEDERRAFVRQYLAQLHEEPDYEFDDEEDSEFQVLLEAEFYGSIYALVVASEVFVRGCEKTAPAFESMPFDPVVLVCRSLKILMHGKERVADLLSRGQLDDATLFQGKKWFEGKKQYTSLNWR